jgi:anti-anti-sigma factor
MKYPLPNREPAKLQVDAEFPASHAGVPVSRRGRSGMLFEANTTPSGSLSLKGELDIGTVGQLEAALAPLIERGGAVTVHVSALDFMDSTGLHSLVRAATAMGDRGCIVIHELDGKGRIRKLIELSQIERLRNIHVIPCDVW